MALPAPMTQCGPIHAPAAIVAPAPITLNASTQAPGETTASVAITAVGCTPTKGGTGRGCIRAITVRTASCGLATTSRVPQAPATSASSGATMTTLAAVVAKSSR